MKKTFDASVAENGREVYLYIRCWDEFGHPISHTSYQELAYLSPDSARYLARQLLNAAQKLTYKKPKISKKTKKTIQKA